MPHHVIIFTSECNFLQMCIKGHNKSSPFLCFLQVDGMDVLGVREATRFAADFCRSGKVKEKMTYFTNLKE